MVKEPVDKTNQDSVYYDYMLEALGEIDKKSEIYVDMDGVLADSWSGKQNYRQTLERTQKVMLLSPNYKQLEMMKSFVRTTHDCKNAKNLLSLIKQVKGKYKILSAPFSRRQKSKHHKKEWVAKELRFF